MGPPITQRCLKTIFFLLQQLLRKTDSYLGGLYLQYTTPEMDYPSREIKRTTSESLKGHTVEQKTRKLKFWNKSNIALQLPLPSRSRKIPIEKMHQKCIQKVWKYV